MALHKMVNGTKVDLSPEEEAKVRAEWAENEKQAEREIKKVKDQEFHRKTAKNKLKALGLSEVEIDSLLKAAPEIFDA